MIIASFKCCGTVGDVQRKDHHLSLNILVTNSELTDDVRVLARAKSKGGGGRDKRKSSIYNSLVDLNV